MKQKSEQRTARFVKYGLSQSKGSCATLQESGECSAGNSASAVITLSRGLLRHTHGIRKCCPVLVSGLLVWIFLLLALPAAGADRLETLRQKADELHARGQNDSAMTVAKEALTLAEKDGNTAAVIGVNSSMGVYLRTMGKIDEALRHYNKALRLCTQKSFKDKADEEARQEAAVLYLNLATLHIDLQHKKEALYYAGMSAGWTALCADKELKAQLLSQNGLIFLMAGDNGRAAEMLAKSYGYATGLGRHAAALSSAAYMVAVTDRTGDAKAAAIWRRRCSALEGKVSDTMTLVAYYQILCGVEMNHGNWRGALPLFGKILSLKGIEQMPFVVYDCYNNIHEAYARLGDWHRAYDYLGKANVLRDSLFEKEKTESLRDLTVKYQAKEKELALARSEAELTETRMYVSVGALAVLIIAALVWTYIQGQRRKAREKEAEFARLKAGTERRLTQRYIDGLENERNRLARELHDGVCNSMYTVQLRMAAAGPEGQRQAQMLDECREQVRRISHELMPPEFSYADLNMVLDDYLSRTDGEDGCRITYTSCPADADWSAVPDGTSLEVYRVVQEAVANALRHSGASRIDVRMTMCGDRLEVTVTDNGRRQMPGQGGIGRRTMRQRAAAVGGRLTLDKGENGTTVRLTTGFSNEK